MSTDNLCANCVHSLWCPVWTELKCTKHDVVFSSYGRSTPDECADFKKRGKDFKERLCHCDDCMDNESLVEQREEEANND